MKPIGFGKRANASADRPAFGAASAAAKAPSKLVSPNETGGIDLLYETAFLKARETFRPEMVRDMPRAEFSGLLVELIRTVGRDLEIVASEDELRDVLTAILNDLIDDTSSVVSIAQAEADAAARAKSSMTSVLAVKDRVHPLLMEHIDASAVTDLSRGELAEQVSDIVSELLLQQRLNLNQSEQRDLVTLLLNDMLGLGPLEPLLADDAVTDIMVNGPGQIYVERKGKLELTDVTFRDEQHLVNVAQRIVSAVGRRVDETSPICDARLADGSRVNVIIPPLAIDGSSISIRKFSKRKITLDMMAQQGNMSLNMCKLLQIAGRTRLNIIISGGTGSGKTTNLNAVSRCIDQGERVVTIEDAAELQLQQPHVVRLETRPANLEGAGEITMRDLVKNALRMRPDRIILGEVRGPEAIDLLQAMNTGHDGSLGTLHANRPREALTRLENMINMAGLNLPPKAIREQIASAVNMIIQVSRMRDGVRRISYITEIVGMEGDVITTQDLFTFQFQGEDETGKLRGEYIGSGLRPAFYDRAEYYGLGRALMECI